MSPTESNENCTIYSISSIVMIGNDKKKLSMSILINLSNRSETIHWRKAATLFSIMFQECVIYGIR